MSTDTDLLGDIEEVEPETEGTEAAEKPAKAKKAAAPKIENGATWLASYVSEQTGTTVDSKAVRMVLRKLNSEGKLGDREAGARYDFTGPEDPRVVTVIDAFRAKIAKAAEPKAPRAPKAKKGDADGPVVEDEDAPVEDLDSLDA